MNIRSPGRARRSASPARDEPAPSAAPERTDLFGPPPDDDPDAADPAALSRTATLASGRAMKQRLWPEARALAALAESYTRLAQRAIEARPPEDPTEPGHRAATEFLAEYAVRHLMAGDEEGAEQAEQWVETEAEAAEAAEVAAAWRPAPTAF